MTHTSGLMKFNMEAFRHNLHHFFEYLKPNTKLMIMIKAFAYGMGTVPIAQWAEKTGVVDYLAVAYVSEGVDLRRSGHISLPIMVMVVTEYEFDICRQFNLEPVMYSMHIFNKCIEYIGQTQGKKIVPVENMLS